MIQASKNITIHARRWSDLSEIAKVFLNAEIRQIITKSDWGCFARFKPNILSPMNAAIHEMNESLEKHFQHAYNMTSQTFLLSTVYKKRLLFIRKVNRGIQKSEHRICFEFPARAGNLKLIPRLIFWTPKCFFWKFSQARIVKKYAFFEFLVGVRLR